MRKSEKQILLEILKKSEKPLSTNFIAEKMEIAWKTARHLLKELEEKKLVKLKIVKRGTDFKQHDFYWSITDE